MYKVLIILLVFMGSAGMYGQERVERVFNKETNLIEATYYAENGQISQEGTFNTDGKLHGQWTSYNEDGEKIAVGSYENGAKTGTWYFWADDTLKEVEFSDNQIASVQEIKNSSGIVKH